MEVSFGTISAKDVETHDAPLRDVRQLDPTEMRDRFALDEGLKSFYAIRDLDVDRYSVDGRTQQVVVGARELNPEGIKRDLQLLFNEPGAGIQSLGDRVKHFDRGTLVALLSQREDISEEEANKIADRIESVRNEFVEQLQMVQDKFQSAIDGIFGRIRDYLNSLDRPYFILRGEACFMAG